MPSDLQITNIRDQANANSAITIASDGQVSITQNNPTLTLGSNATFPADHIVQRDSVQTGALVTGSTAGPYLDDTIPQNTEGDQVLSLAFTPTLATNKLEISIKIQVGADSGTLMGALFQDTTANAIASCVQYLAAGDTVVSIGLDHTMVAGTTSPTTFKLRVGTQVSHNISLNGVSEARLHGGVCSSSMIIKEIQT